MIPKAPLHPLEKPGLHRRNRHRAGYDFPALLKRSPALSPFVRFNPSGGETIDFSDPAAVTTLNGALLNYHYGIAQWKIPPGYLCPPIPGRADYLHHVADLLAEEADSVIPRGSQIAVLDIGVGANCIYPILGVAEYGWRFVGTDIDPIAVASAEKNIAANPSLVGKIECRLQSARSNIFHGVLKRGETFTVSICNPPFHSSAAEAAAGTQRKVRALGTATPGRSPLNFGGRNHELWCAGGERAFVLRLIAESTTLHDACRWFTTLVSKSENLPAIHRALSAARPADVRTIELAHGQKRSRIVAWTFSSRSSRNAE